jgi:hypothetical protein
MKTIRLIAGDQEYYLATTDAMDVARASALEALRGGGAFLDVVDVAGREITVLVSPGVPLRFEVTDFADDATPSAPSPPRTIAYDFNY